MILMDNEDITIEVLIEGAVTTDELEWLYSVVDLTQVTLKMVDAWGFTGLTTGATPVSMIPAPDALMTRQVKYISVFNADTVDHTVTIRRAELGVFTRLWKQLLAPDKTLVYEG